MKRSPTPAEIDNLKWLAENKPGQGMVLSVLELDGSVTVFSVEDIPPGYSEGETK